MPLAHEPKQAPNRTCETTVAGRGEATGTQGFTLGQKLALARLYQPTAASIPENQPAALLNSAESQPEQAAQRPVMTKCSASPASVAMPGPERKARGP